MKYLKIFAIAVASLSVTACSDNNDPDFNTMGDVTVEMGQGELSTKEGRGIVKIPVSVTGERNGIVEVTFAIKSDYENPAVDEQNIYMTTNTIVIFPEDNTYNLEVTIVDDKDMNEARYCDVTIVSAEGATVGSQNFTKVEIKDNDSEPYDRCAGEWILKTASITDAGNIEEKNTYIELVAYEEGTAKYDKAYQVRGLVDPELAFRANFVYDKEAKTGYIAFELGQSGGNLLVSSSLGEQSIVLMQLVTENGESYIISKGETLFHINSDFTEMEVENTIEQGVYPEWGFLFNAGGWYLLDSFFVTGMTRPAN